MSRRNRTPLLGDELRTLNDSHDVIATEWESVRLALTPEQRDAMPLSIRLISTHLDAIAEVICDHARLATLPAGAVRDSRSNATVTAQFKAAHDDDCDIEGVLVEHFGSLNGHPTELEGSRALEV